MRRLARLLPYLALLLVVGIAILYLWRAGPLRRQLRSSLASELARQTSRQVSIADVSLSATGQVVLHDLVVRNRDGSPLLSAPEAVVRLGRPASLLSLSAVSTALRSVTLRQPEVTLTRSRDLRWNIEDLLKRKPGAPARFTGDVYVERGRVTVVDQSRGGLATTVENLDLRLRQPEPGQVEFSVRGEGTDNAFSSLEVSGRSGARVGADVSGKISHLDLGYAFARLPAIQALTVSRGRADIEGKLVRGPEAPAAMESGFTVNAEVEEVEVSFPWLRRPVTGVKGRLRLAEGKLHLDDIAGTLAGAPVTVNGTLSDLKDPKLAVDLTATGLRFEQLKQLLPKLYMPATLALPAPLRITARAEGPVSDIKVEGRAEVRVVKFHLVPWHDVVTRFTYSRGRLQLRGLSAHGSPRRLEADIDIGWGKGQQLQAEVSFSLVDVPVRTFAEMLGLGDVGLAGIASVNGSASLDGRAVEGHFAIKQAVARGLALGQLSGDFEYLDQRLLVRRGRIEGPLGAGGFSAKITLPDKYDLEADFSAFDLSALGRGLGQKNVSGLFPASARASGAWREGQVAGRIEVGPGRLQGRALELLSTEFDISQQAARFSAVTLKLARGSYQGELGVTDWRLGERAAVQGRFRIAGADPAEWLPTPYTRLISIGSVDGSAEIVGTVGEPLLQMDLKLTAIGVAGLVLPEAAARVRYQAGTFIVDELTESRTRIVISGSGSAAGLSFEVKGDDLDLAHLTAETQRELGLVITGKAAVRAAITGSWAAPEVSFDLAASAVSVNDLPFDDVAASGQFAGGVLHLDTATVRQAESTLSAAGSVDLRAPGSGPVDLTISLRRVDLSTVQALVYGSLWRLSAAGVPLPRAARHAAIPVAGRLEEANIAILGTTAEPEVRVGLQVDDLVWGEQPIQRVTGDLIWWLRAVDHRGLRLKKVEVTDLRVMQDPAYASIQGEVTPGGEVSLRAEVRNLGLKMLSPWLQYVVDLNGLDLGGKRPEQWLSEHVAGQATVNFDISGSTSRPVLRGDVFLDNPRLGPLHFENVTASPIWVREGVLSIEEIRLRNGPMEAVGQASLPLSSPLALLSPPKGELRVHDGQFAPITDMTPFVFDAQVYLRGNRLLLSQPAAEPGGASRPGVEGKAGSGSFSVQGEVEIRSLSLRHFNENRFRVTVDLNQVDLRLPDLVEGRLNGRLLLVNDPDPVLETARAQPLVFSDATLGLPRGRPTLAEIGPFPFAPGLRVRVAVGERVQFRYGLGSLPTTISLKPGGYLFLGGKPTAAGVVLNGQVESDRGVLSFPNGTLSLRKGTAHISRQAGQTRPRIWITDTEADGRIGDYYVSLSPTGQIYPSTGPEQGQSGEESSELQEWARRVREEAARRARGEAPGVERRRVSRGGEISASPLQWNAVSIPALDEVYIKALLLGPVLAPAVGESNDIAQFLANPRAPSVSAGQVSGFVLPSFVGTSLGLTAVYLETGLGGPTQLRVGERIFRRVLVSYVSPLSGPPQFRSTRITYEITPRWSVGLSSDALDKSRWDLQAFIPF